MQCHQSGGNQDDIEQAQQHNQQILTEQELGENHEVA